MSDNLQPMSEKTSADVFNTQIESWKSWQEAPWGRIRYRVVAETLRRTCAGLGTGALRVLDVGGGDGIDALALAEAGHDLTVADYSATLLAAASAAAEARGVSDRFRTVESDLADLDQLDLGVFDLVLCHNVVQYQPETRAVIDSLVKLVGPHGALSIMAINPPSDLLTAAIRENLDEAERMLTATTSYARTFGHEIRRVSCAEVEAALAQQSFIVSARYGIRAVVDYISNDARKHEPGFYDKLERLELILCDQEPYLRTARLWQLVARREELCK